jgi:hypothetical protein
MTTRSFPTTSDLSANLNKFVRFTPGARTIELNLIAGTPCLGVLTRVYSVGATQYGVVTDGPDIQQVVAGGAFSASDSLSNDATGRAVKTSNLAGSVPLGVAVTAGVLAALAEFEPFSTDAQVGGLFGVLTSSVVDGATLTAAAAASMIPAANRVTVPANAFKVGQVLRVRASGRVSTVITTPGTMRFDLRYGGVVFWDSLAVLPDTVAAHVTVGWSLYIDLICRAAGATANFFGQGFLSTEDLLGVPATAPKGNLVAQLPWNAAPAVGANIDNTVAGVLDVFFTQTAATGSLICHEYVAELLPPGTLAP